MPVWRGESLDRDAERYHRHARELTGSAPNMILASASQSVAALQQGTQSVPIFFRAGDFSCCAGFQPPGATI
jgi:hypothetical protein